MGLTTAGHEAVLPVGVFTPVWFPRKVARLGVRSSEGLTRRVAADRPARFMSTHRDWLDAMTLSTMRQLPVAVPVAADAAADDGTEVPLRLQCEVGPFLRVVTVDGDLDIATIGVLGSFLRSLAPRRGAITVIDVQGVPFCGLVGLRALERTARRLRAGGETVRLSHVQPVMRRLIDIVGAPYLLEGDPNWPSSRTYRPGSSSSADHSATTHINQEAS